MPVTKPRHDILLTCLNFRSFFFVARVRCKNGEVFIIAFPDVAVPRHRFYCGISKFDRLGSYLAQSNGRGRHCREKESPGHCRLSEDQRKRASFCSVRRHQLGSVPAGSRSGDRIGVGFNSSRPALLQTVPPLFPLHRPNISVCVN